MKKCYRIIGLTAWSVGLILNEIYLFFGDRFPDFWAGFMQGLALVGMVTGIIYIICCVAMKQNPFKIQ